MALYSYGLHQLWPSFDEQLSGPNLPVFFPLNCPPSAAVGCPSALILDRPETFFFTREAEQPLARRRVEPTLLFLVAILWRPVSAATPRRAGRRPLLRLKSKHSCSPRATQGGKQFGSESEKSFIGFVAGTASATLAKFARGVKPQGLARNLKSQRRG